LLHKLLAITGGAVPSKSLKRIPTGVFQPDKLAGDLEGLYLYFRWKDADIISEILGHFVPEREMAR
jgi:hypothetical protein